MKKLTYLYENGDHSWAVVARDPERQGFLIDTNEYLIASGEDALLVDPGGSEIFAAVFAAIAAETNPIRIKQLFASHQDPDIISSLALWLGFNPEIKCYLPWLWSGFIPHFGGQADTFVSLPDEGGIVPVGRLRLQAVPAHYLHSSGNLHLYDEKARIYFSGDVGAALLPPEQTDLFVTDFSRHIGHAETFHKRWMGSKAAVLDWCERVSRMDIDMLCPQHGAIYRGDDVMRFINWFAELEVGSGLRRSSGG